MSLRLFNWARKNETTRDRMELGLEDFEIIVQWVLSFQLYLDYEFNCQYQFNTFKQIFHHEISQERMPM